MKALNYQDVFLVPQKCIVNSRQECNTQVQLGKYVFESPVYPANMKSVVDINTCLFLAQHNWFYTMHRFEIDIIDFILTMQRYKYIISISVGVNQDSYDDLYKILDKSLYMDEAIHIDYITIDVANAWSDKCRKMIDFIKEKFPNTFLIVGNVATFAACRELQKWGANAIKIGVSCGRVCITRNKTGFNIPMIQTLKDCCREDIKIPIIADGGIQEHGDIAKAIAFGATMVMAGSLFAGYKQSAGNVFTIEDRRYKEYFGSSSKYNKKKKQNIEGSKILVPYKGNMENLLIEIKEDLQSSISYGGGKCVFDLQNCPYIVVN
jgi:GMP reductase